MIIPLKKINFKYLINNFLNHSKMKKSLLFVAALALGASAAFAQVENPVLPTSATFSPASPEDEALALTSVNDTITVNFDVRPNVPVTVMYATGGGFDIGMSYERINMPSGEDVKSIQIPLNLNSWGIPFDGVYYLHMVVTFTYDIDVDGETVPEYYLNDDGEPVMFEATYVTPDTGDARMVKNAPNNGMFNEYFTFADAYEDGNMYVYFSKTVTAPEEVATITLYNTAGAYLDSYEATLTSQEWSEMDGLYQIVFPYASADYSAAQISKIEIQLSPVQWENPDTPEPESITSPLIVLNNNGVAAPQAAPRKAKKGVANGLAVGTESVNVYNLQGMLVVKNASNSDIKNLAPGMYIVNGKKFVVK